MIYGIEEAFCDEVLIRKAIVDAACEEIVIVHCKGDHQKDIIEQFKQYQEGRIAAYDKLLNQQKLVKQAEIITYGNYVLFVAATRIFPTTCIRSSTNTGMNPGPDSV
ncbi:DUF4358 domain-containing protein [uncultured Faecalibaculum sp.]|uniref:DUF4358 domain-containing protein n=1 Tax=uncultured Faecalibaculum sp. TaxID=1729681 RepID=UPI00272A15A8|nr:DUF4358 domain-containing protein [uncultured Faecalibaculum sp.]